MAPCRGSGLQPALCFGLIGIADQKVNIASVRLHQLGVDEVGQQQRGGNFQPYRVQHVQTGGRNTHTPHRRGRIGNRGRCRHRVRHVADHLKSRVFSKARSW